MQYDPNREFFAVIRGDKISKEISKGGLFLGRGDTTEISLCYSFQSRKRVNQKIP